MVRKTQNNSHTAPGRAVNKCLLAGAVVGLLLTLGVLTVFSTCGMKDDGTWMHCHDVRNVVACCGVILALLQGLGLWMKQKSAKTLLALLSLAASALVFLLPGKIMPMCMMHTMRCYTVFQPFVRIMTILLLVLNLASILLLYREKRQ